MQLSQGALQVGAITLTILGNKSDMAKQRAVSEEEARGYAESIGAEHHHVSAKTGEGLSAALRQTVHRVLQRRSQQVQQHPQSYMPGPPRAELPLSVTLAFCPACCGSFCGSYPGCTLRSLSIRCCCAISSGFIQVCEKTVRNVRCKALRGRLRVQGAGREAWSLQHPRRLLSEGKVHAANYTTEKG